MLRGTTFIGTNRRVKYTPTEPEAIGNILSPYNETHFTNGTPMDWVAFHWYQSYHCYQWMSRMHPYSSSPKSLKDLVIMRFISPMEYLWIEYHSIVLILCIGQPSCMVRDIVSQVWIRWLREYVLALNSRPNKVKSKSWQGSSSDSARFSKRTLALRGASCWSVSWTMATPV